MQYLEELKSAYSRDIHIFMPIAAKVWNQPKCQWKCGMYFAGQMDGIRDNRVKQNKADPERENSHVLPNMKHLKKKKKRWSETVIKQKEESKEQEGRIWLKDSLFIYTQYVEKLISTNKKHFSPDMFSEITFPLEHFVLWKKLWNI